MTTPTVWRIGIVFLLLSCKNIQDVTVEGVRNLKLGEIADKEVHCSMDLMMKNPNGFSIKLRDLNAAIKLEGKEIGMIELEHAAKLKAGEISRVPLEFTISSDSWKTFLGSAMKLIFKDGLKMGVSGSIKAKALMVGKRIEFNQEQVISKSDLGL
jgi:LEA14-like dessication related protein